MLWKAIYFLRAVAWMLAMVVLGLLATVFEVLTFPVFYFIDPTYRVYQYLVCVIAQISLYPVIRVRVQVGLAGKRHRPSSHTLHCFQPLTSPPPLSIPLLPPAPRARSTCHAAPA